MSALSTEAIFARLRDPNSDRLLVVRPLLDPDTQAKPGQASIDVRLGFEFCVVTASSFSAIDEFGDNNDGQSLDTTSFSSLYRRIYVPFGGSIIIHPHQFILAQTLEYMRLPSDLMCFVVGRSTWGRLGLIVATAIGVHPGFSGNLTLELRNLGETPLRLYPGQSVAQLFFETVNDENGRPQDVLPLGAQYSGTVDMVPRKISSGDTRKVIEKMISRYRRSLNHEE